MSTNQVSQQTEVKNSMRAAVADFPHLQAGLRELASAVELASRSDELLDNATLADAGLAIEQIAAALEMAAAGLRAVNRKLAAVSPAVVAHH